MGGSGIWAMHFIANRAIVLDNGDPDRQINYSPVFTALSFFLPIMVLLIAFYFLASTSHAKPLYIVLAGTLAGTAICGMHYLGDHGIANYTCTYRIANVVGAAIIAVAASLIALSVFFRLRETWTDTWLKRTLCAAVLASAVAGMHWTAVVGTQYRFKGASSSTRNATRVQTVIVCAVLSVSACVILLAIVLLRGRKILLTKTRAQQVVLACAYFDENGKLMLTRDGTLPCEKITNRFVEKTFGEDELSRSHQTFTWVFKASRNWPSLKDVIPGMAENLSTDPAARKFNPGHATPDSSDDASEVSANFGAIFKQLFCVAAQRLANTMHEPLENIGVLFEEPLETGALHLSPSSKTVGHTSKFSIGSKETDVERDTASGFNLGRGKYLFLNRGLTKPEVDHFAAMGFRFGSTQQISELLAKNMEVPHDRMKVRLDRMKLFASVEHLPPPGVHIACFILRPSVHKSFDILVPSKSQNQLPLTSMQGDQLNNWQSSLLDRFDEWTVKEILTTLINETGCLELERDFRWQLHSSLIRLIELVGEFDNLMNAKFSAKTVQIPCRMTLGTAGPRTCALVTIRLMNTVYSKPQKDDMTYIPLSFFSAQQQVDSLHPNHEAFAKRVKMEFGYGTRPLTDRSVPRSSMRSSRRTSMGEGRHHRFHDPDIPSPTSIFKFKNALRPNSARKSEENSIVRVRDVSVGESEDKSVSEVEDLDAMARLPTPPTGTLTAQELGEEEQRMNTVQDQEYSGTRPRGIELVAISAEENGTGNWVQDLFGLFGLGPGPRDKT